MAVTFTNNVMQCKDAIDDATIAFLYEAGGEIEAETKRNAKVGKVNSGARTKNKWAYHVDESKGAVTIGNTLENAIWEEFGTGEWAANGDGRKGGWYIPIGNGHGQISQDVVDAYHMKVVYGKNGMTYAYTEGKKPKHTFQNAYIKKKNPIIARAKQIFAERMGK